MPIVQVHLLEGREEKDIKNMLVEVTEAISNSLHVEKERVRIIVNEIPSSHWGIAGVSRKEIDMNRERLVEKI
ncbi:4-oxalocrotonate tautomerase [Priestia megaterium]